MAEDRHDETIEARPVLLDDGTDLGILTDAEKWTAEVAKRATDVASRYEPHEIVDDDDYRRSKADRTAARKQIKEIDDERKSKTALIEGVLKDFRAGVKDAMAPLSGIDAAYKGYIDDYDAKRIGARMARAREVYESEFPDLAKSVPFETLEGVYGRTDKWRNASTSERKLLDSVRSRAKRCVAELDTISKLPYSDAVIGRAHADYLRSLDLNAVTAQAHADWENEQAAARRRAEEAAGGTGEAKGEAVTPGSTQVPGLVSDEAPVPAPAQVDVPPVPSPYQTAPTAQGTQNPFEQTPQAPASEEPDSVAAPMGIPATIPNYDAPVRHRYRIETDAITDEQLAAVDEAFKRAGVHATLVVIG